MAAEVDIVVQAKELWLVTLAGLGAYLKHFTGFNNKAIPIVIWVGCVGGEVLITVLTGGSVTWFTYLKGIAWGAGLMGLHSGPKNILEWLKELARNRTQT